MNKKKKLKDYTNEDVSIKKHKPLNGNVTESKVVKSKLKLAEKNATQNKNVPTKRRGRKNIINSEKDEQNMTKETNNGNRRGRKPKQLLLNDSNRDTIVQNKTRKVNGEISTKRPKGRPRLKPTVTKKPRQGKQPCIAKKNAESLNSATKRSNTSSLPDKIKNVKDVKEPKQKKLSKQSETLITNGESSSDFAIDLPSTSKMQSSIRNKKFSNKITSSMLNSKNKTQVKNKRKRVISHNKSILHRKRGHRVASLNASAKVKVLCGNDRDSSNVNKSQQKNSPQSKNAKLASKSKNPKPKISQRRSSESNQLSTSMGKQASKKRLTNKQPRSIVSKKKRRKRKRNLVDKDVEIIDTRRCKRMASLNASAMMAATYLPETRIAKRNSFDVQQPKLYLDPISTVSETIEQVVSDQWSSTVEQHFEISPGSSSNVNSEQKLSKTTVKTTVKHVKLRGHNTVVETISTEYQQQNIVPELLNGNKTVKGKSATNQQRIGIETQAVTPQVASTPSSSAFTPCSSTNPYLGSNSIGSIALLSTQPNTFSSSVSVQNYQTESITSNINVAEQAKKRPNRNKPKEKQQLNHSIGDSPKKSRSIIRKYEVKTIETRMESTGNESNMHNSMLSNSVIFANNHTSPLINLNNSCLPRSNQSLMYPHQPYHLFPSSSNLSNQSVHPTPENTFLSDSSTPLNYINVSPFNTPVLHYQPISGTFAPLSSPNFSSPISVPFLLSNTAPPFHQNSYSLINQRANHLPVSSLFGLPYLNSHSNTGLYQPPNPVINILPSNPGPSSGCALIHRPVAYHPQSGQVSATTHMSNLVNSSVFSSSPLYGNLSPTSSNLFQCSMIRSPSVASLRSLSLPVTPYTQPTVFVPTTVNSINEAVPMNSTIPFSTLQTDANVPCSQSMSTTLLKQNSSSTNSEFNRSNIDNDTSTAEPQNNSATDELSDSNVNSHIQQLAHMTNNIIPNHNSNNSTSLLRNSDETVNRSKQTGRASLVDNGISEKNSNQIYGKKSSKLGANTSVKTNVVQNGVLNRNLNNGTSNEPKRSKLSKNTEQNGSKNVLSVKNINNDISNLPVQESNLVDRIAPQESSTNSPVSIDYETNSSLLSSGRLLAVNNSLKKNRRPIIHGWSWEGEPIDRNIFINNDDQPYLRACYPAIRHTEGEIIRVRDCVLLKSGQRKTDLPFVAKITALWESLENEMMMSLLWYYRPEHTDIQESYITGEIYASRHRDTNSVACIDDKCYVLTYNEYCRYKRDKIRLLQHYSPKCDKTALIVPKGLADQSYSRSNRIPPLNVFPELVFCCRKVFDFRQKRILKNPNFKMICE